LLSSLLADTKLIVMLQLLQNEKIFE